MFTPEYVIFILMAMIANNCHIEIIQFHNGKGLIMTMNVNLTPQLEDMVRQKVASGLYTSASEVIREALRLMDDQDRLRALKLDQLREAIQEGLNNGPATAWNPEEAKSDGRKRRAARMDASPKP